MPEPEARLGKDANSNMPTLARTEVRTLANINTTGNILASPGTVLYLPHLQSHHDNCVYSMLPGITLSNVLKYFYQYTKSSVIFHPKEKTQAAQSVTQEPHAYSLPELPPSLSSHLTSSHMHLSLQSNHCFYSAPQWPCVPMCLLHPPSLRSPALVPPAQAYFWSRFSLSRNTFLHLQSGIHSMELEYFQPFLFNCNTFT
uniref:Uncharacterized protein n=1 Tax=Pipistrellus kuhlii TaxID=59472 RepID=A0A7J8B1Y7_PIPKU|nr:hypothetical protein mPipKuh1_007735 [Pipistrellus kuhlii]